MNITIKPTEAFAAQLKSKACNVGSSLRSLGESGMGSLATRLEEQRNRPLSDFMIPVKVTIGSRIGTVPAELEGNLKTQAIFELGFRIKVAIRQAENWIAEIA